MGHDYHCVLVQACCLAGSACEGQQLVRRARETQNIEVRSSSSSSSMAEQRSGRLVAGQKAACLSSLSPSRTSWDPSRDLPKLEFVVEGQLLMGKLGDLLEEKEEPGGGGGVLEEAPSTYP
ncbi:uncharacterized protein LOC135091754 isoform X2 [Scylla paramamosain]|uniref:uncharacterized protein LOC135091754 isoform X2 n=1 Tax=Scylla paramamosain TaxID=85552 RepID=UPI00308345D5